MAFVGKTSETCFYPGCERQAVALLYCAHHNARSEYRRGEEAEAEIEELISASTTRRDSLSKPTQIMPRTIPTSVCAKPRCDEQAVPIAPGSALRLYCKEHNR